MSQRSVVVTEPAAVSPLKPNHVPVPVPSTSPHQPSNASVCREDYHHPLHFSSAAATSISSAAFPSYSHSINGVSELALRPPPTHMHGSQHTHIITSQHILVLSFFINICREAAIETAAGAGAGNFTETMKRDTLSGRLIIAIQGS